MATNEVDNHLTRHGKVSYLEIPATDASRSASFYAKVFGWSIRGDADRPSFDDVDGGLIGRWITDRPIASDAGVLPYIYVDRIDETVAQIIANGCEMVTSVTPEGDLFVATFRDPAGNLIGIWQAGPR